MTISEMIHEIPHMRYRLESTKHKETLDEIEEVLRHYKEQDDDLISRQAVLDGIEELKRSPWATDKRGNGFEYLITEALEVVADLCVKQAPSVNPQEPKWIPVSERLPERSGYYLTTNGYHEVYSDYWEGTRFDCTDVVIAWMPLPEPYKVESEDEE